MSAELAAQPRPGREPPAARRTPDGGRLALTLLASTLALFVVTGVNYPSLQPQTYLAVFALLGALLVVAIWPSGARRRFAGEAPGWWHRALDGSLVAAALLSCGWVAVQNQPLFRALWADGAALGDRAGAETGIDLVVGAIGVLVVLEIARRTVGWALPALSIVFLLYALLGRSMPDWLFPHRGYSLERVVAQSFLHSQGVFGVALGVMFQYVYLFVLFGALLEISGATECIIQGARRLFRTASGAPAKVAVLSSGLMGSLSGSAVANTATTGTFTIPLMRSSGFAPHVAAGVEAAASSGGALVPPVMGAGAYMMLELVDPPVSYLTIVKAALLPSFLYYASLFLIVHFHARRVAGAQPSGASAASAAASISPVRDASSPPPAWAGLIFAGSLLTLVVLLVRGLTVIRSVSVAIVVVLVLAALHRRTALGPAQWLEAARKAARGAAPLIAAAACVGIVIAVVTLTGVGAKLPSLLLPLAEGHLTAALGVLMVSSIVLGMGLPSAVCYLLLATLIGPALGKLGVVPLAAHFFIFYFGMMSMVTPPVALAGYAAASIAQANILRASLAAFRFALVGFTLPFMFVYRPQLLLLSPSGGPPSVGSVAGAVILAMLGLVPLAAGIAGYLRRPLGPGLRAALIAVSLLMLFPGGPAVLWLATVSWLNLVGLVSFLALLAFTWRTPQEARR